MANAKDIVRLAVDCYNGKAPVKYSMDESMDTLRQAMVAANNGKEYLDLRDIRDGKCSGLFTLIEEIISRTSVEGLLQSDYFTQFVEYRNLKRGDKNIFTVRDSDLFEISLVADGTQGIRRQRIGGESQTSIGTKKYGVRIYEELERVLAGQVNFNDFISKVSESFEKKLLDDIYALWMNATADDFGGATYFPVAGSYSEDALLDLIAHVEAAANTETATIMGTKKAIRRLLPSITVLNSTDANNEIYHFGYVGTFLGTNVITLPQRHKVNSTEFVFPDNMLTVVAGDSKPLKVVYEGDTFILNSDPMTNRDLSLEYMMTQRWGLAIVLTGGNEGIGRYMFA